MQRVTDKAYWIDKLLKNNLDTAIHNAPQDWDFMFIISGSGMVRVGKTMLAQQIGYYWAHSFGLPFSMENVVFSGKDLIETSKRLGKHAVIIYDEAREDMESSKFMRFMAQNLRDYFSVCGMYNQLFLIVIPDFFELPRNIAVTRSDALINVFRKSEEVKKDDGKVLQYERGWYEFYNKHKKRMLYLKGKKFGDYSAWKYDFYGEYRKFWVLDRDVYDKRKIEYIRTIGTEDSSGSLSKRQVLQRDALIRYLAKDCNLTLRDIADVLRREKCEMHYTMIGKILQTAPFNL